MTTNAPIINGGLDSPLAWLSKPLLGLPVDKKLGRIVSRGEFIQHVLRVAEVLPDQQYAINLCDNRYLFLVSTWAVIVCQQSNLLPPNKNPMTQLKLARKYEPCYAIHDGPAELAQGLENVDISQVNWALDPSKNPDEGAIPSIAFDHPAIISFTSGSTGESKPNLKTWQTLVQSTAINAKHMLPNMDQTFYHLATVPGQHMWGLETSVLLPVFANACLVDARPMFPNDIVTLVKRMPSPISLISTPLHLRALSASSQAIDEIQWANTLCATAPLNSELAQALELQFSTELREVYGCSEVGSMAVRRTATTGVWQQFDGLNFSIGSDGAQVNADYLPAQVQLEDALESVSNGFFKLAGRLSDQIKIAGKRGSLHEANTVLSLFDGVIDGVVIFPEQDRLVPRLVAMVVLKEGVDKNALRDHFRDHLDFAFVPRPIYIVESLPREENGKLLRAKVLDLYQMLATKKSKI
jgi:acyl-coenzyme A synthetase/AMP-(fatty) acid ligase